MKYSWISLLLIISAGCTSYIKTLEQHRVTYREEFLQDPRSPLDSADLQYLDFYPADPKARVKAIVELTPEAQPFELPTYSGLTKTYRKWGVAKFQWRNEHAQLSLYENISLLSNPAYKDYLFLPFKDATNGVETYGGGRYINLSKSEASDGKIDIDFNTCYNPWCAYSDGYNCPVPPAENTLPFSVEAGERNYKGVHKGKAVPHQ